MKLSKALLVFLMLGGASILATSCGAQQNAAGATQEQPVAVGRGDIIVDITAAGNLALSVKEDLAFDIPGTVEEVLVEEGDSVKKDQVLARLDTSEWDKQLSTLEKAVNSSQRQVTATQKTLRDKQNAVVTAQNLVTSKEYALRQAQLDLQSAQDAVTQIVEIQKMQDQIDSAQEAINLANRMLANGADFIYWTSVRNNAQDAIKQYEDDMKAVLAGASTIVSNSVALDVARKQFAVEQKQFGITQVELDVQNAKLAVEDARNAIAPAQEDVQNAQDDLVTAQNNLDDAKAYDPEVTAPFDGFITKVNVKGGDDVKKGTVAVTVADPNKFEADVLVNETDIASVRLGSLASVELQSSPGTLLSANVTHISPTATIQQGVVNYKVTVEVGAVRPAAQPQLRTGAGFGSGDFSPGNLAGTGRAFASGNLTEEQTAQFREQAQQGGGARFGPGGAAPGNLTQEQIDQFRQQGQQAPGGPAGTAQGPFGQASPASPGQTDRSQLTGRTVTPATLRLAEGMTVSVSLPVDSRTSVIVVPNSAVTTKGGQTSVKVRKADGTTEDRVIQPGISDYQNTEVLTGLSEGETVVIIRKTSTTSTTSGSGNQIRVPGGGAIFGR